MKTEHGSTGTVAPGRVVLGGFLMGLANLVPGVSGGTMILALGLYDRFIGAVAELTSLRWKPASLRFLALVAVGLAVAVLGLATPAVWLVTTHRWVAYSLFIGLTLGGVPLLWRVVRPLSTASIAALVAGVSVMALVAFGLADTVLPHTFLVFLVIGALAASSMILPGISGSYILLIFGLYDVVIGSLRPRELLEDPTGSLGIVVPVGLGVVLGIGALSNVLKFLLARFERPAHAALLGLLLGSVFGLWPFQEAVHPELVTKDGVSAMELLLSGEDVAAVAQATGVEWSESEGARLRAVHAGRTKGELKLLGLQLALDSPSLARIAISIALVAAGFAVTRSLGAKEEG